MHHLHPANTFPYHALCMRACVPVCLSVSLCLCETLLWLFACFVLLGMIMGTQRTTSAVTAQKPPTLSWRDLSRIWNLLILVGWLLKEPQRSSCLFLPSTGILSRRHHTWLFTWVLGSNLDPYVFRQAFLIGWAISTRVSISFLRQGLS